MNGRLRCAGVVEFGGLRAPPARAPFGLLRRNIAALFSDLTYDRTEEWMGHRPATADSLPVIGHQHIGLSGGPKTGRWLAYLSHSASFHSNE